MDDFDDIFRPDPPPVINDTTHPAVQALIDERNRSIPLPVKKVAIVEGSNHKRAMAEAVIQIAKKHPEQIIHSDPMIIDEINSESTMAALEIIDDYSDLKEKLKVDDLIQVNESGYYGRKLFIKSMDDDGIVCEDEDENLKGNKWANWKACFPWCAVRSYISKGSLKSRK